MVEMFFPSRNYAGNPLNFLSYIKGLGSYRLFFFGYFFDS